MAMNSRSRGFCFTINNWNPEHVDKLGLLGAKYVIYGKEVGASGTPHLQGYIHFTSQRTLRSVIKKIPGAHVEVRRGPLDAAIDYCKKEGDYVELGEKPMSQAEKGERGKEVYEEAWRLAKAGKIEEVDAKLRLVYYRTLNQIAKEYALVPSSNQVLSNEWYVGPSGSGKSRLARTKYPRAYIKNLNKWWDGYNGEETVIIDEWSPGQECLASFLKIWSDHYPFRAEVKGSSMMIRPVRVIVTSNYTIEECFPKSQDASPLVRRFSVVEFSHRGGYMNVGELECSQ